MITAMGASARPARALSRWRADEAGNGEVATALFVLPIMIALLFVLIEVGFSLKYRSAIDNVVQDTVLHISQDGAVYWDATMADTPQSLTSPAGWEQWGKQRLINLCYSSQYSYLNPTGPYNATESKRCRSVPTMACTVTPSDNAGAGINDRVALSAGSTVSCTGTFPYRAIAVAATTAYMPPLAMTFLPSMVRLAVPAGNGNGCTGGQGTNCAGGGSAGNGGGTGTGGGGTGTGGGGTGTGGGGTSTSPGGNFFDLGFGGLFRGDIRVTVVGQTIVGQT